MGESISNFYSKAKELSVPGVYVYIDDRNKEVFVSYSRNMLESIYRNIRDGHYINTEVVVLDSECPVERLKLEASWWMNEYRNKGYRVLNKVLPVKYKLTVNINKYYQVEVILKPARSKGKVLRIFTKMEDALQFIEQEKSKYIV